MQLQLIRHATLFLRFGGLNILVDPMLSADGAMKPVEPARNTRRIPMVPLPFDSGVLDALIQQLDIVLVTHIHRDHWDEAAAAKLLPRDLPILCQPPDLSYFQKQKFQKVVSVENELTWEALRIHRTGGQHGTGEIGQKMGHVSGFVLQAPDEPTLYLAGDTIWCDDVAVALKQYQPQITVLNAGAAQFLTGGPITMTAEDVLSVHRALPTTHLVAVHMETVNHCELTREALRTAAANAGLTKQLSIPADGETLDF